MVAPTNYVIARAGITLRKTPGTSKIFAASFCQTSVKTKKVIPSERGPWPVTCGKSGPGYFITFIKSLNEDQRLQLLGQNP